MKSNDLLKRNTNTNNNNNLWQISKIKLPYAIISCKCIITDKNTNDPSLNVIGGFNYDKGKDQNNYWEFKIRDIIGNDSMNEFLKTPTNDTLQNQEVFVTLCHTIFLGFFVVFPNMLATYQIFISQFRI